MRSIRAATLAQAPPLNIKGNVESPAAGARRPALKVVLWVSMFVIFAKSPVLQMNDSQYSMLTAESLIHNGTPDLSYYSIPEYKGDLPFATLQANHAYQLARTNGRLLYGFAHGSSLLSMPFVAIMSLFGVSPATRDRRFDPGGELMIQKLLAAILSASMVTVFFCTAALVLSARWSAVVAIGAGMGTQVWSTASRGMWSHTWEMTLGSCVVYLLLASEIRRGTVRPVILASLLSWMFFVRPGGAIAVMCVSGYVLLYRRAEFVAFAAVGLFWLSAFIAYSLHVFGTLVPYYYLSNDPQSLGFHVATGLYGALMSPSRGILLFCPIVAWVLFAVGRYWRSLRSRALAITATCTSAGILLAAGIHPEWWGGACYGPRLMADAVPWFVLLSILGIDAMPPMLHRIQNPMIAAGAFLLIVSIAMNACGAISRATMAWNFTGPSPAIMLDWSRPQFFAAWLPPKPEAKPPWLYRLTSRRNGR